MPTPKVAKPTEFVRCPGCGKFCLHEALLKAARDGHKMELGTPTGGGPWLRRDMPPEERAEMARLLRQIADRLETP